VSGSRGVKRIKGSVMRIRGAQEGIDPIPPGIKMAQVLERGERFELRFEDGGGKVVIKLEELGNSVSVRDGDAGKVLYMG
jgi:hypothetical protein